MTQYARTSALLKLGFWLALGLCSYMAFAPPPAVPVFRVSDIILHAVSFAVLVFALRMAYLPLPSPAAHWWQAGLWMLAYGIAIELVQSLTPERSPEVKDVLVDVVGIAVGLVAFRYLGNWSIGVARWILR